MRKYAFTSANTAGEVMTRNSGAGPGFDLLRIVLSLLVILLHSFHVSYPSTIYLATNWSAPIWASILPIFFSLSGFLVAGSAVRSKSLKVFLSYRVLRIVPALSVEVTLSALLLGPLLTSLPLSEYFSRREFPLYFANIVGWIHFHLPGVFLDNPRSGIVNQSLWTLHAEFLSYFIMIVLIVTGFAYRKIGVTCIWLIATIVMFSINMYDSRYELRGVYPSDVLTYYFLCGVVAYHWKDRIILDLRIFALAVVVVCVMTRLPQTTFIITPLAFVYMMVYIGMINIPKLPIIKDGDYSYGLYLYSFPIQQTLVMVFPQFRHWLLIFVLATLITMLVAYLSWSTIEKPALRLKRLVSHNQPRIASLTEPSR